MELVRFSLSSRLFRAVVVAVALAFAVLPLAWIVAIAVRPGTQAVYPISIIPSSLTLDNITGVLFGFGARPSGCDATAKPIDVRRRAISSRARPDSSSISRCPTAGGPKSSMRWATGSTSSWTAASNAALMC